jgi:RecJ-like exonuclease
MSPPSYTEEEILFKARTLLVRWAAHTNTTMTYLAGVSLEVAIMDLIKGLSAGYAPPDPEPAVLDRPPDA